MFCPVYGCNSNSKNNPEKKIHFFAFPKEGSKDEQSRRRIWIDFCRRKNFVPSKYTGLCSKHFRNDSYILSHSPEFLSSLNFVGKRKLLLKPDAVPTVNAALDKKGHASEPKKRQRGTLSRKKEVECLMSEAECSKENDGSQLNTMGNIDANEEAEQTSDNQYENTSKSTYCQTVPLNYFVRSSSTQTRKSMLQSNVAEKGTQTYITGDSLSKLMPPETVSTSSQTDAIDDVEISGVVDDYKNDVDFEKIDIPQLHAEINDNITVESENSKSPQQLEDQFNDSECSNEEFLATSGDESETDDECPDDEVSAIDEEIILTTNKSIQSQLKFIICEESIAKTFSVCLKCGSKCSVSIRNKIGSYCVISVSCLSAANHNISWPTAPY